MTKAWSGDIKPNLPNCPGPGPDSKSVDLKVHWDVQYCKPKEWGLNDLYETKIDAFNCNGCKRHDQDREKVAKGLVQKKIGEHWKINSKSPEGGYGCSNVFVVYGIKLTLKCAIVEQNHEITYEAEVYPPGVGEILWQADPTIKIDKIDGSINKIKIKGLALGTCDLTGTFKIMGQDIGSANGQDSAYYTATCKITVIKCDLRIWNGGSSFDLGPANHNDQTPDEVDEKDEESIGAYILVNCDDDDGYPGDFNKSVTPDMDQEGPIRKEDNLAKLEINAVSYSPQQAIVTLIAPSEDILIKFWRNKDRSQKFDLIEGKKVFDLSIQAHRDLLEDLYIHGLWIEGYAPSWTEKDVTIELRFENKCGNDIQVFTDKVKATIVMLELGAVAYREMGFEGIKELGHTDILYKYFGKCTKDELKKDTNYEVIGSYFDYTKPLSPSIKIENFYNSTNFPNREFWGIFRPGNITYIDRLKILKTARYIENNGGNIKYCGMEVVKYDGDKLDGSNVPEIIDKISNLRCDGLVEIIYELNGINVWGRKVQSGATYNWSILNFTNEHNDPNINITNFNWGFAPTPTILPTLDDDNWKKFLTPATQCGMADKYKGSEWQTTFVKIDWGKTKPKLE